jgi:hypothetical protein
MNTPGAYTDPHTCGGCGAPMPCPAGDADAHRYCWPTDLGPCCIKLCLRPEGVAEADAPELAATRGLEDVDGWATVVGGEVVEVFGTRTQAADLAEWLVSQGGALVATVQPYSPEGIYLPDDHGC